MKYRKHKKCSIFAAILNFIIPGLGYLYIEKRKIFGILLIIGYLFMTIGILYFNFNLLNSLFGLMTIFIIHIAFAYDGYKQAEETH